MITNFSSLSFRARSDPSTSFHEVIRVEKSVENKDQTSLGINLIQIMRSLDFARDDRVLIPASNEFEMVRQIRN